MAYAGGQQEDCPEFTIPEQTKPTDQSGAEFVKKNKQLEKQLAENEARLKKALEELEASEKAQKLAQIEASSLNKQLTLKKSAKCNH